MFDTFAYIEDYHFDGKRDRLLPAVKEAGITRMVSMPAGLIPGMNEKEEIKEYPWVCQAVGLTPGTVKMITTERLEEEVKRELKKKIRDPGTCAVVTGLDFSGFVEDWIEYEESQRTWSSLLIRWAIQYRKPLILVCKDSYEEMLELLLEETEVRKGAVRGVVAGYDGDLKTAMEFVNLGFMIGIGTDIFHNQAVQKLVRELSLHHLVVGSGGPCEYPRVWGGLNTPLILPRICKRIADLKNVSLMLAEWWTTSNAESVLGPVRNIILQKQKEMEREQYRLQIAEWSTIEAQTQPYLLKIYPGLKWYWELDEGETFQEIYQNVLLAKERVLRKWLNAPEYVLTAMELEYLRIRLVEDWLDERPYYTEEEIDVLEDYMERALGGPVTLSKDEFERIRELVLNRKAADEENEAYMEDLLLDAFEMQGMIEMENADI